MIDPMASGTIKRPYSDLRRPRGREALSAHPCLTTRPEGASSNGRRITSAPASLLLPETAGAALPQHSPPSPRSTPSPTSTPRPTTSPQSGVDPDPTGPHSQTIPGLPRLPCADTSRQRSIATVLINEASFEELVNAHTEGAFTWRQLARAAQCQGTVSPLRIRLINAFATPPPRPEGPPAGERTPRVLTGYGRTAAWSLGSQSAPPPSPEASFADWIRRALTDLAVELYAWASRPARCAELVVGPISLRREIRNSRAGAHRPTDVMLAGELEDLAILHWQAELLDQALAW